MKSTSQELESLAVAERYLREVGGLSRSHAVAFVSRVKRIALGRRRFSLLRRLPVAVLMRLRLE